MPTYDYECRKCGHRFEKFQSIKDNPLKKCPKCSGKVQRLIGTGAGILFKGSGFYQTDYRSSKYQESSKKDKPSSPSKESKDSSKKSSGGEKSSKKSSD